MTNYSLRARMMILILAPTVLIGLLLSIFFVAHRYHDLQRQLEDAGASIIEPLAVSSEYGMNLQNRESIGQLISVLHRRHSDIVRAISIYDSQNRLFVTSNFQLNPSELRLENGEKFPRQLSAVRKGDVMILRTPIVSESYSPDESPMTDAKMPGNMLGYVALELDLKSVRLQQYKEIFISSVMMLFCIGIALIFGWRLMRDVTGPIRNMVNTVDRIRRGQLDSRVEGFMLGELDMLKNGINSMAMSLAAYHEEMQHNIDQATSDLRETLEQMEIQNVELDLAKKRAQEAARIKSEFLANMSHELRTPLNGVIGFTRLTLKTDLNTTQRDHLTTIERSANNLLAIINDVLDFSKLEAGKLILESIPFLLRNALDEVMTLLAHSAHDKGLELTLNIKNDVPDNIIGDPLRLQQIITNLVGNAIKFTEHGNIDVLVEQRALSNTSVQIEIQIHDTGSASPSAISPACSRHSPGRCQHFPPPRRHRARAGDNPAAGKRDGRRYLIPQPAESRLHVLVPYQPRPQSQRGSGEPVNPWSGGQNAGLHRGQCGGGAVHHGAADDPAAGGGLQPDVFRAAGSPLRHPAGRSSGIDA
ncbi:Signal transduction histidine-protein kinase BarA [Raoultella planticola]|uniref:histidine kinase n=1 Tax=Raoultella planticola TaxID=575 RepID=A0A485BQP8_RAOPL|nr:Signal transduction histidine-protein kinase BarA [Raoultella planticola]